MVDPPLPFGNAAARWYFVLLRGLVTRGHRVTAFASYAREADRQAALDLFPPETYDLRLYPVPASRGWRGKLATVARPFSFLFSREFVADFRARLTEGFDLIHLEHLWGGWYCRDHANRTLVNVQYLLRIDLGDDPPRGWRARKDRLLSFAAEARLVRAFRRFRVCTPRLTGPLLALNPAADVTTIPLGLETDFYPYIPDDRRSGVPTVTLIGSMNWFPSYSAAVRLLTRLWPGLKSRVPAARLLIVGWNARGALADYLGLPDVTVLENVPETRPYFEETGVFLYAPSRGSGMKIKVQEAMAYGVPVVTTSEGVEGLPAEDGVHAGIADDDAGLIARAAELLGDAALQNRRRRAARALIEATCGPGVTLDAQEACYARLLADLGPGVP